MMTKGTNRKWKVAYGLAAVAMLALLLMVVVYVALTAVARADRAGPTFVDVDPWGAQADEIGRTTTAGYMIGVGGGMFEPDRAPTRGEIAVVLVRCKHGPTFEPAAPPTPTVGYSFDHWAAAWIYQAVADGTIGPMTQVGADGEMDRGDLAALVAVCRLGD